MPALLLFGYGFLGKKIVELAKAQNWSTYIATRSPEAPDHYPCDLGRHKDLKALSGKIPEPQFAVHCASSSGGGKEAYHNVFLEGIKNITDTFPSAHHLFVSSTSVYGQTDGQLVNESSETIPPSPTGQILLQAEQIALQQQSTVLRLAGLYGPSRSHLLKRLLLNKATIEERGTRYINQIHRDDAASAVLHLLSKNCRGLYNGADSTPMSQLTFYTKACGLLQRPSPPAVPHNLHSKRGWSNKQVSNAKLRSTGWTPQYASFFDAAPKILPTIKTIDLM